MTITENIKKRCAELGISVTKLEKMAGVANGIVGKWNEAEPNLGTLRKIAAVLDCTIDDLING